MKIAISSEAMDLEANVDPRFGRARCFIFYDTDSDVFEARSNEQVLNIPQGAGIQAAQHVIDYGAEVLLTGHCGPNAYKTLQAGGVKIVVGVDGTVKKAIEQFKKGVLKPAESPDVEGHW
jgi:predicted Fe-Mo cluster-binding NifX family protein